MDTATLHNGQRCVNHSAAKGAMTHRQSIANANAKRL